MSIPPTGKPVFNNDLIVDRMAGGKIAERWQISDSLSLMQQLAVIPAPQGM
jgi:predicted ester cyclase